MKFQSVAVYALAAIAMITGQSEARLRDGRRLWVKQAGSIIWNDINRGVANGECNGRCKDEMDDDESVGNMYPDGRGLPIPREPCARVVCPRAAPAARICRFGEEPNCGCCGCSCYDFRTDTATYKAGDNGFNQRSVGDLDDDESVGAQIGWYGDELDDDESVGKLWQGWSEERRLFTLPLDYKRKTPGQIKKLRKAEWEARAECMERCDYSADYRTKQSRARCLRDC